MHAEARGPAVSYHKNGGQITVGTNEPNRETWVDFVRATAAFLVVWIHAVSPWLIKYGEVPNGDWQTANIPDSATRMSVPLFFMVTGYLLLNRPLLLGRYFWRRFARIVVPWVV